MAKAYHDSDADLSLIQAKKVAIIGYGSQGHAHALNLKDSGVDVRVGLRAGSANAARAEKAGLVVGTVAEVSQWADVIMNLTPDQTAAKVYHAEIEPYLADASNRPAKTLMFAHGFNIRFRTITPPAFVDVSLVAPKAPGHRVREVFTEGGGVPALVKAGFETLVEAGYQPELAYFEVLHELKLIVDLLYRGGLEYMRHSISDTAEWGDYVAGPRIVTPEVKAAMHALLNDIRDGSFARRFIEENETGRHEFTRIRKAEAAHQIEKVGAELRKSMPFLDPVKVENGAVVKA